MKTLQLIDKQKRKFRVGKTEFVYQKDKKCTQSKIKIMSKYELQPCIRYFNIGEIEVSIDLTEKEVEKVRQMTKGEFSSFVKSKAIVKITDFDIDYDVETFDNWVKVDS